jgi:hypothetical protein
MAPNQKDDEDQKAAARRDTPAAKPGAVAMSSEQAARLDQRIAEKRGQSDSAAPQELGQLEQDLVAKQKGRAGAVSSKPGAFSAAPSNTTRSELSDLEADVAAKQRARPGASAESLDSKVAAKVRGDSKPTSNDELNNLEAAVQAKMRSGGAAASGISSPGARASLTSLEDEVTAKQGGGRNVEVLSALDERIAAKNAAGGSATMSAPRSLQEAEDSILKKKGAGEASSKRNDSLQEQYPNQSKEEQLDSGLQMGLSPSDNGGLHNPDLEYGVYGGPEEKGLAVAFAVEEEGEDMFIPSAVEYDPDAKPPMYRNRRFRLYASLALVVVIVGTIGAAVGITLHHNDNAPPEIPYRETLGIRENVERIVGSDQLDDRTNPYRKALDWLTNDDPMQITPEHPQFTQRYLAAYFYFATSVKHEWSGGCNRPVEGEEDDCLYHRMVGVDPVTYTDVPWKRWLSSTPECTWAGIYCDEAGQFRSMDFSKSSSENTFETNRCNTGVSQCDFFFEHRWFEHDWYFPRRSRGFPVLAIVVNGLR